jgi:outer membrane protein assembly factor BamB
VTILVLLCSATSCTQKQKNDELIETKDGPKMNIETLASSLPSTDYSWIVDDMYTPITLLSTEKLSSSDVPQDWRSISFLYNEGFFFDAGNLYVPSPFEDYLYERISMDGYERFPFLQKNDVQLPFSFKNLREPSEFISPMIGYLHNEDVIMAVEKTQEKRKILWEHTIPKISNDSHDIPSWGGFIQTDMYILYTSYTGNSSTRIGSNVVTCALSKDTGELVWEVKNPVEFGKIRFWFSKVFQQNGEEFYLYSLLEDKWADYSWDQTLYIINASTGKMHGQIETPSNTSYAIDPKGSLLQYYFQTNAKKEKYVLANVNVAKADSRIISTTYDFPGLFLLDASENSVVFFNNESFKVFDTNTFQLLWEIDDVTGYSKIQPNGTIVVILNNRYICQVNVRDGSVCKYWNLESLLPKHCTCINYDNHEGNLLEVSPDGTLVVLVDEQTPISSKEIQHKQMIVAFPLLEE